MRVSRNGKGTETGKGRRRKREEADGKLYSLDQHSSDEMVRV